jgi:Flp pilus assembly protein TadD
MLYHAIQKWLFISFTGSLLLAVYIISGCSLKTKASKKTEFKEAINTWEYTPLGFSMDWPKSWHSNSLEDTTSSTSYTLNTILDLAKFPEGVTSPQNGSIQVALLPLSQPEQLPTGKLFLAQQVIQTQKANNPNAQVGNIEEVLLQGQIFYRVKWIFHYNGVYSYRWSYAKKLHNNLLIIQLFYSQYDTFQELQKILSTFSIAEYFPINAYHWLNRGVDKLRQNYTSQSNETWLLDTAIHQIQRALTLDSNVLEGYYQLARALGQRAQNDSTTSKQDYSDAVTSLTTMLSKLPKPDPQILSFRGWMEFYQGDTSSALIDFQNALKLDSTYVSSYSGVQMVYTYRHQYAKAERVGLRLLSLDSNEATHYLNLTELDVIQGNYAIARKRLKKSKQLSNSLDIEVIEKYFDVVLDLLEGHSPKKSEAILYRSFEEKPQHQWDFSLLEYWLEHSSIKTFPSVTTKELISNLTHWTKKFHQDSSFLSKKENHEWFTQMRLSAIVVPSYEIASNIHEELSKGALFSTLVKQYSTWSPTQNTDQLDATNPGDMGYIVPSELATELRNAVSHLEVGDISDVVQTPNGFLILLRTD